MRTYNRDGKLIVKFTRRDLAVMLVAWAGLCLLIWHVHKNDLRVFLFRQARGTWFEQPIRGWALQGSRDPVTRDLASGRFQAGDPSAEFLDRHPPLRSDEYGRYTLLLYYTPRGRD